MKLKPLADRILIKETKAETKTAAGIILPEAAQEKTNIGTVKAIGPGTTQNPMTVKEGNVIMFNKYAGTKVKVDEEDLLIMSISDVIAIIEK